MHVDQLPEENRKRIYELITRLYKRHKDEVDLEICRELEQIIVSVLENQGKAIDIRDISKLTEIDQKTLLLILNKSEIIEKSVLPLNETATSVRYSVLSKK